MAFKKHDHHESATTAVEEPPQEQSTTVPHPATLPPTPLPAATGDQPSVNPLQVAGPPPKTALVKPTNPTTHFFGPITSGNVGLHHEGYVVLCKRLDFDVSQGPVPASTEVDLPQNCLLLDYREVTTVALDQTLNLTIGLTSATAELLALQALSAVGNATAVKLNALTPSPTKFFVNLANATTAPTVGKFSIMLLYVRD